MLHLPSPFAEKGLRGASAVFSLGVWGAMTVGITTQLCEHYMNSVLASVRTWYYLLRDS